MTLAITSRNGGSRCSNNEVRSVRPLISIIIVVFQDREELRQIIQSILPRWGQDVELIVIDGGSDDGTVELLRNSDGQIDYWMSEADSGIYDAMNKGVAASSGEYIFHLNAGDRLVQMPLASLRQCLDDGIDVASFRVIMDGKDVYTPKNGFPMKIDNWWHHQGTFYRRSSHLGYDPQYRICGDFELNQRLLKAGVSVRLLPDIVAEHQNNGVSSHPSSRKEIFRSIRLHFGILYLFIAFVRFQLNRFRWEIARFFGG
jgi:glycosyltransferase involved in cell wall biosynthesis